jgi:glucose uptake protein
VEGLGIVLGLLAAVFWGSYLVPVRKTTIPEGEFTLAMGAGVGVLAIATFPWFLELMESSKDVIFSMSAGLIWSVGNICSLYAVRGLGLSKAVQVFSISVVINGVYGIVLFNEFGSDMRRIALLFVGIMIILLGVVLALSTERMGKKGKRLVLGLAVICGIMFGTYNAPIRATTVDPAAATVGLYIGMVVACIGLSLIPMSGGPSRGPKRMGPRLRASRFLVGMLSGAMWGVGTAFSIYTIRILGLAVSFPVFMVNILINVGWGLFYFKEVRREHYWKVSIGALMVFGGAIMVVLI